MLSCVVMAWESSLSGESPQTYKVVHLKRGALAHIQVRKGSGNVVCFAHFQNATKKPDMAPLSRCN